MTCPLCDRLPSRRKNVSDARSGQLVGRLFSPSALSLTLGPEENALAVATSAHAVTLAPLHQPDDMITQVREACGVGMHYRSDLGRCVTTPARRQARRCLVWGAGHVCRKWG